MKSFRRFFSILICVVFTMQFSMGNIAFAAADGADKPLAALIEDCEKSKVKLQTEQNELVKKSRRIIEQRERFDSMSKAFKRNATGAFNIIMIRFLVNTITSITTEMLDFGINLAED